jgi:AcrR family transcriptional regulator
MAKRVDQLAGAASASERELRRWLIAGMRKLIQTRVNRGEAAELPRLGPELWKWLESVVPPPRALERPRRPRSSNGPRFQGYTAEEKIAHAVAAVLAEKGYGAMSTDDIAAAASISLSTFYAHFEDKQGAVLGALEMSGAQVTALGVRAARRAGDWRQGVRAFYEAICTYFAAEPEIARMAMVDVYGAGPRALKRRDRVIDALCAMLAPGLSENPDAPAISAEAVGACVYALLREQVRRKGPESLPGIVPLATYLTLVGFLGAEEAVAIANDE